MKKNFRSGFLCLLVMVAAAFAADAQPAEEQDAQQTPAAQPAPAVRRAAPVLVERNTGDGLFSIQLDGWRAVPFRPKVRTGKTTEYPFPSNIDFQKRYAYMPGGMLSIPVGRNNTLRFSYFQAQRAGDTVATANTTLFDVDYRPGTAVSTTYEFRHAKVSLDYLSWPFPVGARKFRLKSLWELHYTSIKAYGEGMSVADDGTEMVLAGDQIRSFVLPAFGLATEYSPSRYFRWEFSGSGFAFPGRAATWNAQTAAVVRAGRFEVLFGGKAFYFRTSPKASEYLKGTMYGPYVGLRFYP